MKHVYYTVTESDNDRVNNFHVYEMRLGKNSVDMWHARRCASFATRDAACEYARELHSVASYEDTRYVADVGCEFD